MISSGWYCHQHRARFVGAVVAEAGEPLPCGCRAEVESYLHRYSGGKDGKPWDVFNLEVWVAGVRWPVLGLVTKPGQALEAAVQERATERYWTLQRLTFVLAAAAKAPGRGWTDMQWRDHMAREATHDGGHAGKGGGTDGTVRD